MMKNTTQPSNGWSARLDLAFTLRENRTVLTTNRHDGPLRLQRPLYPEKNECHVYVLHPPGGVVGGDRLQMQCAVQTDAAVLITTPGATKFYRSSGATAYQKNYFQVQNRGFLEWLPQESIIYPQAQADIVTHVDLTAGAGFMGWEIVCLGLRACGQPFGDGDLRTRLSLQRDGRPLFTDHLRIHGEEEIQRPAGLRGRELTAIFLAVGCRPELLDPLRQMVKAEPEVLCGVTLLDDLLVVRWIGGTSSQVKTVFQTLWSFLRPHLGGRNPSPPRIWST